MSMHRGAGMPLMYLVLAIIGLGALIVVGANIFAGGTPIQKTCNVFTTPFGQQQLCQSIQFSAAGSNVWTDASGNPYLVSGSGSQMTVTPYQAVSPGTGPSASGCATKNLALSTCTANVRGGANKINSLASYPGSTVYFLDANSQIVASGTQTASTSGAATTINVACGNAGKTVFMPSGAVDSGASGAVSTYDTCSANPAIVPDAVVPNKTVPYLLFENENQTNNSYAAAGAAIGGQPAEGYRNTTMTERALAQGGHLYGFISLKTNSSAMTCAGSVSRPDGMPTRTILALKYNDAAVGHFDAASAMALTVYSGPVVLSAIPCQGAYPGAGLPGSFNGQCWAMTQFCPYKDVSNALLRYDLYAANGNPTGGDAISLTVAEEDFYTEGGVVKFGAYNSAGTDQNEVNSVAVYQLS